jgi:hypothetical protein
LSAIKGIGLATCSESLMFGVGGDVMPLEIILFHMDKVLFTIQGDAPIDSLLYIYIYIVR